MINTFSEHWCLLGKLCVYVYIGICVHRYMCTCVQGGVLLCTLAAWLPLLDPVASSILKDMERPGTDSTFVFTELSFRFSYQFVDQFSNLISNQ